MKDLAYLKAERDTLQDTVNQINKILETKRGSFTADEIVMAKRRRSLMISQLKTLREEIKNYS